MLTMNIEDGARFYIQFIDETELVKITATDGYTLIVMGVIQGKEHLVRFLDAVGVDHYLVGGDSDYFLPVPPIAYQRTPRRMIEGVEHAFDVVNEVPLKILSGEELNEEDLATTRPLSLRVLSSTNTSASGFRLAEAWFKAHARQN